MLTLQTIKADPEFVIERLAVKGFDGREIITKIIAVDTERRRLQQKTDSDASELKKLAATICKYMQEGNKEAAEKAKEAVAALKQSTSELQEQLERCESEIRDMLLTVPNLPCAAVPEGKTAEDNVVEKTGGVDRKSVV